MVKNKEKFLKDKIKETSSNIVKFFIQKNTFKGITKDIEITFTFSK